MINKQSAANTQYYPLHGFEYRYQISKCGNIYDIVKDKLVIKDHHSRVKLDAQNGKSYNISIGKLLHSTFEEYNNFDNYDVLKSNEQYLINRLGSLYSLKRKMFITAIPHNGYMRYNASLKQRLVHRLLAEQYLENPNNLETVNHIDGNKLNNALSNLEWCSQADNNRHAWKIGLQPESRVAIEFTDKIGNSFYLFGLEGVRKVFNINKSTISIMIKRYEGTEKYVPTGALAGFKIKKQLCKVHRLSERSTHKCEEMADIQ
jgi:hypothetical protein